MRNPYNSIGNYLGPIVEAMGFMVFIHHVGPRICGDFEKFGALVLASFEESFPIGSVLGLGPGFGFTKMLLCGFRDGEYITCLMSV